MAGYKKLSDTWRNETAPETFAGFATFAGGQGQNAKFELPDAGPQELDSGAAKAAKADAVIPQKGTPTPAQAAKVAKVGAKQSTVYRGVTADPDGTGCEVTIGELPATGLRYHQTFGTLQLRPPAHVPEDRWRMAIEDGRRFLATWGSQAEALGWTSADLFGLHTPPEQPHPSYSRLSRYDETGLVWLLLGREVVALTEATAAFENPTGSITTYRRFNKPALGPLGDSLDDLK